MVVENLDDLDEERTTAELLGRVDTGKQWLDDRLAQFPEERLDDPVDGGWTRRQMLRHLTVWHELTVQRLQEYQRTGQRPAMTSSIDEINDEAMKSAAGRTREQLLADLDASFLALRVEVAKLRDNQLPELEYWPAGVVAGNTFGHYYEHAADLEPA